MAVLSLENDQLKLKTSPIESTFARYIKGGRFDQTGWRYSFSEDKIQEIKDAFPDILIDQDVQKHLEKEKKKIINLLAIKNLKDCDLNGLNLKTELYAFQKVAIKYLLSDDALMNACQMGTGKCIMSLATIIKRKNEGQIKKCLIISPASVKGVWIRQIAEHTHEEAILIEGNKKNRINLYETFSKDNKLFMIINYDLVRQDIQILKIFWNGEAIIFDESAKIKNPRALQTKASKELRARYRMILSGFPICNRVEDIWSQLDILKPGYLGNYWSFQDRYLVKKIMPFESKTGKQIKIVCGYKNLDELKRKLEPYYIRFLRDEVMELPEKIYQIREVELGPKQRKQYNQMKEEMIFRIEKMDDADIIISARDILCQLIRLSQLTDGFITDTKLQNPVWLDENSKFSELDEIVEETIACQNKLVIWSRYVPVSKALYKRYKEYNPAMIIGEVPSEKRDKEVMRFQEDKNCKIFLGQVVAAGMGISLVAASTQVFVEKGFLSPATLNQAEDRLVRPGQKKNVLVISLIGKNTIDERWEKLLKEKEESANIIFKTPEKVFRKKEDILEFLK